MSTFLAWYMNHHDYPKVEAATNLQLVCNHKTVRGALYKKF